METAHLNMEQSNLVATWNRPRTTEELLGFISTRHANLPDDIDFDDVL